MIRDERTTCSAPSEQSWRSVDTRNEQVPRTLRDHPHPGGSAASARAARKRRLALGGVASQRYRLTFKDNAPFLVSGLVSPASVRHGVLGSERAMARWKGFSRTFRKYILAETREEWNSFERLTIKESISDRRPTVTFFL